MSPYPTRRKLDGSGFHLCRRWVGKYRLRTSKGYFLCVTKKSVVVARTLTVSDATSDNLLEIFAFWELRTVLKLLLYAPLCAHGRPKKRQSAPKRGKWQKLQNIVKQALWLRPIAHNHMARADQHIFHPRDTGNHRIVFLLRRAGQTRPPLQGLK